MRRLKTVRRPPIYPKTPGHLPCSSLTHPLPLSSRRPSVSFGGFGIRAGIEGTNSELKRAHGLGRLRVRGGRRVRLAVYLKALACNFKRMVHARLVEMENTAQRAVGTVPAVAAA